MSITPNQTPATIPPMAVGPAVPVAPQRSARSEERFFLLLSIFIGIYAGLAVVCFRLAIEWTRTFSLGMSLAVNGPRIILAPAIAGLIVAFLVMKVFPAVRGSGVNQTKSALYISNGYIPLRTAIGKFICCALAIGAGHSLGPEDPSLQIGATLASALGRRLRLSREKTRLIAPIGAAAGLAAAFNAPISAVLFVIEEVVGRWSAGILGSIVLAAVSSVVVARFFLGAEPMFRIPTASIISTEELLAYALLGVAGGIAALIFAKLIGWLRPILKALPRWTQYFQPAIAGALIGTIGYFGFPQIMGAGYDYMDQAMHNQFTWKMLLALALLKIIATTLSFTSGTPGGMFAPALFVGAMLGAATGGVERIVLPHLSGSVGTYALVGMGVLFAAFLRAPLTSVFMVLEVSGNYSIIIPVILANTLAYLISRSMQPTPIFEVLTRQDGLELPSMEEQREADVLRVEDAMRAYAGPTLESDELADIAGERAASSPEPVLLVRNRVGRTWGSVRRDMLRAAPPHSLLAEILPAEPLPVLFPDIALETAIRKVHGHELIPVINRADPSKLEGVLTLDQVLRAFSNAQEGRFE
ncbi:MAG TPA: chloride channel protein [Terriglobales bacterium]|nr:chloride channel protein [Terriglobales bacterium]